jgi:hypothetical protein
MHGAPQLTSVGGVFLAFRRDGVGISQAVCTFRAMGQTIFGGHALGTEMWGRCSKDIAAVAVAN